MITKSSGYYFMFILFFFNFRFHFKPNSTFLYLVADVSFYFHYENMHL